MRRLSVLLIVGALTAGAWLTQPRPAAAGEVSISIGVGFVVGGATFRVVHGNDHYVPYYYRLETPLYDPGYDCTTYCYVGGGYYYHAPFCPLVRVHFDVYRYHGYWRDAYRHGPRYRDFRHHRYPRHDRWYPGRYDRRGHSRHYRDDGRDRHRPGYVDPRGSRHRHDRPYDSRYGGREDERSRSYDRSRSRSGHEAREDRDGRRRQPVSRGSGSAHRTRPRP